MIVQEKFYSAEEFWELSNLPENENKRLELIEGELIEMPPAGGKHGGIVFQIGLPVGMHVKQHKLGYVTAAETGYVLHRNPDGKDTVRAADLGFVAAGCLPDGLPSGHIPFAPDFAVEVVSPSDRADQIEKKVTEYLQYGTRLLWVVYPATKTVVAYTSTSMRRFEMGETLDGGDVLPGLTLAVADIFAE
ncbi:MAG: Uma2 family endonuclease [Chloroflexota bacterium]